jgi:mRNA interferase MazF
VQPDRNGTEGTIGRSCRLLEPAGDPYLSRVTVAPITSSIRDVPSEVRIGPDDGVKQPSAVNLHPVLTVAKDSVGRRVAQLGEEKMQEVCRALGFALGCAR